MTSDGRRSFGVRVAEFRNQRGLTQKELAAEIGRTASWLSQVERGVQPVNRLDVLRLLADALGVSLQELQPGSVGTEQEPEPVSQANDLDQARLIISGHPALNLLLEPTTASHEVKYEGLRSSVDQVWQLAHDDRFADLSKAVEALIPRLEQAARTVPRAKRPAVHGLRARAYQALAAAFVRQNEGDAAWVAADRAIGAAELSDDPLLVVAGTYRLAHAFVRLRRLDQAEHTAESAVSALRPYAERHETPEALSLLGSLHLVLAVVHARAGDHPRARAETDLARRVAVAVGEDRNDFNVEFGPTNVEVQAVSVAVELGNAGEALEIAAGLDSRNLSIERQARLSMDIARAHAQLRRVGEAVAYFLRAEQLAPEMVRGHVAARAALRDLLMVSGRTAPPELRALAQRADAMP
ncbi:helix-turn-helix domain-containing protein [Streptomyces sp. SYSU K217416]